MNIITNLYRYISTRSIKHRLMLLFLFFSLFPIGVVGYFSYSTASQTLQVEVKEKLQRISKNKLNTIDRILFERLGDVRVWSALELAKAAVQVGSGVGGASDFVNYLIRHYRIYQLIMLLDANGICVTVNTTNNKSEPIPTNKLFLGHNFQQEFWFNEAIQNDGVVVTDWHRAPVLEALAAETDQPETSSYSIVFASAIKDFDGTILGVWVNFIHWESIQEMLEQIQTEASHGSTPVKSLLLLSENDTLIAYSGIASENDSLLYGKSLSSDLQHPQLASMLAGQDEGVFSYSWDGVPKTIILSREQGFEGYAGNRWGYLTISDNSSTYAPIHALRARVILFGIFLAIPLLFFAYFMGHRVTSPLVDLSEAATAIASGDLTPRIPFPHTPETLKASQNEVKILVHSFSQMTANLHNLLHQIKGASNQLGSASGQISSALEYLSTLATQQSSAIVETTATVEDMATASREIAKSADTMATFAETTEKESRKGVQAAVVTLARIHAIKQANDQNMQHVMTLHERSKEIHEIVEVITAIADTTDLIAFNAALEAAGAGDKGKRFGVVAGEIRRLANTVATSVNNINQKTTEIQSGIHSLVGAFENETQRVESGLNNMKVTATSLEAILGKIEKTTASVMQISTSTRQQQASNEQIVSVLQGMSEEILQFQDVTRQTLDVTADLQRLAETLQQSVNVFRVEEQQFMGMYQSIF